MGESKEFCGGTHVARTGGIAFFKITEETGIAQGVRRLEAVTGAGALDYVRRLEAELDTAGGRLRVRPFEVGGRIEKLQAELREREREVESLKRRLAVSGSGTAAAGGAGASGTGTSGDGRLIEGARVIFRRVELADPKTLRETADALKDKYRSAVVVLAGVEGD